ncbi:MAG: hypothetical protein SV375_08140 [Thermodesulfobacteriota bacterium]|nr:hypothetical protein [Thermodesulfobacteriota bacterium]
MHIITYEFSPDIWVPLPSDVGESSSSISSAILQVGACQGTPALRESQVASISSPSWGEVHAITRYNRFPRPRPTRPQKMDSLAVEGSYDKDRNRIRTVTMARKTLPGWAFLPLALSSPKVCAASHKKWGSSRAMDD